MDDTKEALKALVPNAKIRIDANNCWEHVKEAIKDLVGWDVSRGSQHDIWAIEEPLVSLRYEDLLEFSTLLDCQVILDEAVCNVCNYSLCKEDSAKLKLAAGALSGSPKGCT